MTWIITHSGKLFDYRNPACNAIDIDDIAQALSHESRFAGHTERFYSVAQHSVFCSHIVEKGFELEALLHDATEAYCKDIPTPLKKLLPHYRQIENNISFTIRHKFNLPMYGSPEVKEADLIAMATEFRDLKLDKGVPWPILNNIKPSNWAITPVSPELARSVFLRRFYELTERNSSR